jgi:lipopolysaccharide assembly outer membrane protein LptD (OstA)
VKAKLYLIKIALLFGAFFLMPFSFKAQKNLLELLPGAKKLGYNEKTKAHRLIGPVNFIYQGNTMYSDSAHFYDKTNEVRAYGNVHIVKDDLNLYCDSLYYNGKTRKAKLWGHVRVRDSEYKLTTDTLEYDAKKKVAIYHYGGKIEGAVSKEVLTSQHGYMYPDSKNVIFGGKVRYKDEKMSLKTDTLKYTYAKRFIQFYGPTDILSDSSTIHCEKGWYNVNTEEGNLYKNASVQQKGQLLKGDTLIYQPKKGLSKGYGNVFYQDTVQKMTFYGDKAIKDDQKKSTLIKGHAVAVKQLKADTMYLHADSLLQISDSLDKPVNIKAFHHAQLFHKTIQGKCDSLVFNNQEGKIEFWKSPIVWAQNGELKGDFLIAFLNDSIIERVEIQKNASAIMEVDSGLYYNQLAGKEIIGYLKDNELYLAKVIGNARTIFFPLEEEKKDSVVTMVRKGMNRLYASELKVYLDSGEVNGVTYYEKPDGIFYPMDQINKEEQWIPDFNLNPALRPKDWKLWLNPKVKL